jgi:glycosyltransferase involved in cell wall biosynthesis
MSKSSHSDSEPAPSVSVVIPARNAENVLPRCLESVFASEAIDFEVIVVDDASTDATLSRARGFPCRVLALRNNVMSANARNLGARHARGEVLVFVDADELLAPDTLARFNETLDRHPEIDAVVGSLTADTPEPGFFSRFKNFQHHFTHQTARTEGATLDSGRMAIRRATFERLGGFEPAFSGASIEDIALGYRMTREGHRIRFEPSIQLVHLKGYTLPEMVRSDILCRAIPWTGLMLRDRIFRSDLNTRGGNVASVIMSWLLPTSIIAGLWWRPAWALAVLLALLIAFANRSFLAGARREFGLAFALRSALFLPAMYFYQGLGLAAGLLAWVTGRSPVTGQRQRPETDYELLEPERESAPAGSPPGR